MSAEDITAEPAPAPTPQGIAAPADENAPPVAQTWPDTWRGDIVKGMSFDDDADGVELGKVSTFLERLKSPSDLAKSYRELQKKQSSAAPAPLERPGADASAEQLGAYREANGIPATADKYEIALEDGLVVGDDMKEVVSGYLEHAHGMHQTPEQVNATLSWFMRDVQAESEAVEAANQQAVVDGRVALQQEWGSEFTGNMNALGELPKSFVDAVFAASDDSGLRLSSNPDIIREMVSLAKALNPTASLVPPGANHGANVDARIKEIEDIVGSRDEKVRSQYYQSDSMQKEYSTLLASRQKP